MIRASKPIAIIAVLGVLGSGTASADDLTEAAGALCEKIKVCSMAQIDQQDLTPEMREMMEPMLENMCVSMKQGVQEVPTGHELYQPAVECMRSMAALSCDDFQDDSKVETPACKKYQELAEKSYDGS
jgi:hypothetical protein